jgi:hypothetical protein
MPQPLDLPPGCGEDCTPKGATSQLEIVIRPGRGRPRTHLPPLPMHDVVEAYESDYRLLERLAAEEDAEE